MKPRLTLQTLTRGDGLLGLRPLGGFGPRDARVTVAHVEQADAEALAALHAAGLHPLPAAALQWRSPEAAVGHDDLWSLKQEAQFGDFFADEVPRLQARGWSVVVMPGFDHGTLTIDGWKLVIDPATGEERGRELTTAPRRAQPLVALSQPHGMGSWLLSLGIEVAGLTLDLVPLLADLLKRDPRWTNLDEVMNIADEEVVKLRLPEGKRIETPAAPLKPIVGAMLDLLLHPRRRPGPLKLASWEAARIEALRRELIDAKRAGSWQLQGNAALAALVDRLREAGLPRALSDERIAALGLGLELRDYQRSGVAWLQHLREQGLAGILADDMGLGKTAQVLAHLLIEKHEGRLDRPALVVLPTSLIANWQAEARRVAPSLAVLTVQGAQRAKDFPRVAGHDLVLTTYPLLWRDLDRLRPQPWHLVVLDEAQMVKNAGSRAATALRRLQARHRLCVTGTPLENHLGELWAQFDFLMPGFLGDWRGFLRDFRRPIEQAGDPHRARLLAARVKPFILRRRKQDVAAELPEKTELLRRVQLEGEQRALYESVRVACDLRLRKALDKWGFEGSQIAVLDALLKLRQVCCDPRLLLGEDTPAHMQSAKMAALLAMLPALVAQGRRVLVFSQFSRMLALVKDALDAIALPCFTLTGDTPVADRGDLVRRFQAGEAPVFLISLKAGGVGLNLTAADTVIHLDPWWNPAVERQATDRAHRIGQRRPVFVYKLLVEGSIEERMLLLQDRKAALAEGVLGSDSGVALKFGPAELDALMAPLAG